MLGKIDIPLRRIDDALGTSLEGGLEERNEVGGSSGELVGQLFVVGDEVGDVNVAVVLLDQHIFADLIAATAVRSKNITTGRKAYR